ncbi:hypothetical protein DOTSEDRAFT_176174 [Dothistroma septosporum NZE10]|uniref:FAD-binding domain-containing protein n=1 Tax=Dothistroma septosporum (strain NZE10 / CBS 128990) TaxID=675120 RepID=N1PIP5_DOTSN|nr:hypothetical protein DOTSEDRAFT_176174 [Dothistroma septosporum NZE10]
MAGENNPFRVAIVGGGLGGLFCALAIRHHCDLASINLAIDVYEQASQYKEIGAGIGVGVNAAKLFHKLDLGERLNAISGHRGKLWLKFRRFDNSEEIFSVKVDEELKTIRQASCARTDLLELMRAAVEERKAATLHTNKKTTHVEDLGDTVRLHFSDDTSHEADLVIACDGIHSAIRHQFVQDDPQFSGWIAYRGIVPLPSLDPWPFSEYNILWVAKHKHFLIFPISANKELNIVAFVIKSEDQADGVKESWTSTCDRRELEVDFAEFEGEVQKIIKLLPQKSSKWRINDRPALGQWHYMDGKVILLGDAAHATTPHLGAGAGQSFEDGWVLGRALSEYLTNSPRPHFMSLSTMADLYQRVRLPRAQMVQTASRMAGNSYELQTDHFRALSYDACLPLLAEQTEKRMRTVWEEDLDSVYETARDSSV